MSEQQETSEEEPSRAAGGCVAVALVAGAVSIPFALAPEAGIAVVWIGGGAAVWWAVRRRRVSDSSATPPPEVVAPVGDVYAGDTDEVARVVRSPEGVMCTIHPIREEVNGE